MGEKVQELNIEQLQEINDELNERNQKLAAQIEEMEKDYQRLFVTNSKTDRMLGKMIDKVGLYEAKIMRLELELEDMAQEIKGYRERAAAAEVPADGE
jgi:predicted nuclease with TOPRIM domain